MTPRSILITGGMGGVGKAVAVRLAADGYRVALMYHKNAEADVTSFVATLKGAGHTAYACDIANALQVKNVIARVVEEHGGLYGCVHTATGPIVRKAMLDLEPAELAEQFAVDVFGSFSVLHAVAPVLKGAGGGVIIGVTSMFIEPNHRAARMGAYVPVKFALRGMLRELAAELMPHGVRVNAVAPSMMQTALSADLPERLFDFVKEKNPMHEILTPETLAGVVSFLCSDDAKAITGVSLPVAYGEVENL